MATKGKNSKVEAEIERCRSNLNWDKAIDLTRTQWTKATAGLDVLSNLLQGEKELEFYLMNNPPSEKTVEKAKTGLSNAEKCLRYVIQRSPKDKENMKKEAVMLLGKLLFAQAKYKEALDEFDSINIDTLTIHTVTNRMLKIMAEGLAVKAMCMEKLMVDDGADHTKQEDMILKYYEQAGDILLLHLQNRDVSDLASGSPTSTLAQTFQPPPLADDVIGPILETAIQKSPLIYIERGQISKGVGRFRSLLRAVESRNSKNLYRLTLARQLAEVLLRGVCSSTYTTPNVDLNKSPKNQLKARNYHGNNMFAPCNEEEEAILLLLIAEAMANKEAVLERRPEHALTRKHAFDNATAVYDLIAITLVRRSNYTVLAESLERAMKFSYEEFHVWYQFALALIGSGKFDRAVLILKECHRLKPTDPTILLLQAKLYYERLHQIDAGIEAATAAVDISDNSLTQSKALLARAVGFSHKLNECRVRGQRQELQENALEAYTQAHKLDPYNVDGVFSLALHLAQQRRITESMQYTRKALKLQSYHANSLALLSLLLSAEKHYEKALEVIKLAISEHPDTMCLLLIKSKLENIAGLFQQSLSTCAQMLKLWKSEHQLNDEERGTGLLDKFTSSDNKSLLLVADVATENGSVRESIAASRVERALSEVGSSSPSSLWLKTGPQHSWSLQAQIWLHLAEIYMDNTFYNEANACVQEALAIQPLSHVASYMKGLVLATQHNYTAAKSYFETALSINPHHVKSMTCLCLHRTDKILVTLRDLAGAGVNVTANGQCDWLLHRTSGKLLEESDEKWESVVVLQTPNFSPTRTTNTTSSPDMLFTSL